MTRRTFLLSAGATSAALALEGCAKFPAGMQAPGDVRLIFRMTIAGGLRRDYVYIIALRGSTELNPTLGGPIPVVQAPSANGFVATSFGGTRFNPASTPFIGSPIPN
ncbi:MAG: hypothetical protein C4320_09115 [Armatimonadota bacterium]